MTGPDLATPQGLVDYAASLDCIHCGLCLQSCPTYRLTGVESSSPRGRIHLMRAVAEETTTPDEAYREELEFCLVCRHCESVCPAGVRMGEMMSVARDSFTRTGTRGALERLARWLGFRVVLPHRTALRVVGTLTRLGQRSGLFRLLARLSPILRAELAALAALPPVPPANERRLLPPILAVDGAKETAFVLEGCVMPELYAGVNRATASVLRKLAVEVRTTRSSVCCGALHAHNGDLEGARDLARTLIESFEEAGDAPVVVNSAGCGAHMKELAHLFDASDPWHARATAFAERVVDFAEFVAPRLADDGRPLDSPLPGPVAWDNPCHLCHGQGVREQPLALLDRLTFGGAGRVPLAGEESCCGSAGVYSVLRPADSAAILAPKLDEVERSGARTLVTANPGCQLQWQAGLSGRGSPVRVVHLAEVLDGALPDSGLVEGRE